MTELDSRRPCLGLLGGGDKRLEALGRGLVRRGFRVERIGSGQEVLKRLAEETPDLLLVDPSLGKELDPQEWQALKGKITAKGVPLAALEVASPSRRRRARALLKAAEARFSYPWRWAELMAWIGTRIQVRELKLKVADLEQQVSVTRQITESKNCLEAIFDGILDSVEIIDPNYRILRINWTNPRLYGLKPQDFLGQVCYQMYQGREAPCPGCAVSETLRTKKPAFAELFQNRRREFAHQYTYPLLDEEGELTSVICYVQDVTEKKRLEQQFMQTEKLSALGELIAGVAHEINNPLTVILGYSQLLQQVKNEETVQRKLEKVYQEALRCQRIIQNLLSFARQRKPEKNFLNIHEILESILELRAYQFRVDNIQVIKGLDPNLPRTMADFYQLQQVFFNLINNAHHAMAAEKGRGTLTVRSEVCESKPPDALGRLHLGLEPPPLPERSPFIRVVVQDDGPGITEENLKRIFDPFFTTKEVGQGTGLGLSVAYGIVREHGGSIQVQSQPKQGAVFTVELPVRRQEYSAEPSKLRRPRLPKTQRILVVDDEEGILETAYHLLEQDGHQVDTALNGRLALQQIATHQYDLIFCDLRMPEMNGFQLYDHIRREHPLLARRFVFFTGDTIHPETRSFLEKTGCPSIDKPFRIEDLREMVQKALEVNDES